MKALLVANYRPDGQQSMLRFADLLAHELGARGFGVSVLRPEPHFNVGQRANGLGKYLGYIDKIVLFPRRLRRAAATLGPRSFVHICDHSNAFYTRALANVPHLVTCHDLLAVRSARGEFSQNPTRWSGRKLQTLIVAGLNAARHVVCVSAATRADLLQLTKLPEERTSVIYNGLNYSYSELPPPEASAITNRLGVRKPFILHVGGDHWYKNRRGVLEIYAALRKQSPGAPALVLVGPPLSEAHSSYVEALGLRPHIQVLSNTSNEELRALYCCADLLLFPSLYEGFGWPIIEAQACGCRVVTTDRPPMNEIAGSGPYIDPSHPTTAANVLSLVLHESDTARAAHREESLRNAKRFTTASMIDGYIATYRELLGLAQAASPIEKSASRLLVPQSAA